MCIAAIAESGGFSPETLKKFFRSNDDGGGFSYAEDGVIHNIRHIMTEPEYLEIGASLVSKTNLVTHCRIATSGAITEENSHPFPLGADASLVHNGVLFYGTGAGLSDTHEFVVAGADLLGDEEAMTPAVCKRVEELIGHSNKFIILYKTGSFKIINELSGYWETNGDNRVWYSNAYWKHAYVNDAAPWDRFDGDFSDYRH